MTTKEDEHLLSSHSLTENERLAVITAFNDFLRGSRTTGLQHIYISTIGFQRYKEWCEYAVEILFPQLPREMGLEILKYNEYAFWTRETLQRHVSGSMLGNYGFKPEQPDRYEDLEQEILRLRKECAQLTDENLNLRFRESPLAHLFQTLGRFFSKYSQPVQQTNMMRDNND